MAPNKLDIEFREKLNQREIAPSPAAWDRLDAMLAIAEEKKAPKKWNFLFIAAGFIGILLMGTLFFQHRTTEVATGTPEVVLENHNEAQPVNAIKAIDSVNSLVPSLNPTSEVAIAETTENVATKKKTSKVITDFRTNNAIAQSVNNQTQDSAPKAANVNVDELLAAATTSGTPIKKSLVKVDAGALLSQVDGELELSFREKVIQSADKKFQNIKVALANRNLE